MGTALQQEILALAAEYSCGKIKGAGHDDMLGAFGFEGDDADEFLEAFAERFSVDFSSLRWEFHYNADEPPGRRRVLPLDAFGEVIPYQPITLELLEKAVLAGKWGYDYPEHTIKDLGFAAHLPDWRHLAAVGMLGMIWAVFW